MRDTRADRGRRETGLVGILVLAWLAMILAPVHNIIQRSNQEAVSQVGVEAAVEIGYFGIVGLVALAVIRDVEPVWRLARPPMVVLTLPLWVVASGLWSESGAYAAARGIELVVVGMLAWATIAVGRADTRMVDALVSSLLRRFVSIVVLLAVAGMAFGPVAVPASSENLGRFTWVGAHPNGSGLVLALALVVVLTAPSALRLRPPARFALGAGLLALLVDNRSRTAWVSLAVALVVVLLSLARRHRWLQRAMPVFGGAAVAAVAVTFDSVTGYFLRGQRPGSVASGNGRLDLWPIGFDALSSPFDWAFGLGYGAARTVFIAERSWATTAHSSILALLVSGGIVAVVLLGTAIWSVVVTIVRSDFAANGPGGLTLTAMLAAVCVNGLASDVLAEPNIGFAILALVTAVVSVHTGVRQTTSRRAASRSSASSISTQPESGVGIDA